MLFELFLTCVHLFCLTVSALDTACQRLTPHAQADNWRLLGHIFGPTISKADACRKQVHFHSIRPSVLPTFVVPSYRTHYTVSSRLVDYCGMVQHVCRKLFDTYSTSLVLRALLRGPKLSTPSTPKLIFNHSHRVEIKQKANTANTVHLDQGGHPWKQCCVAATK